MIYVINSAYVVVIAQYATQYFICVLLWRPLHEVSCSREQHIHVASPNIHNVPVTGKTLAMMIKVSLLQHAWESPKCTSHVDDDFGSGPVTRMSHECPLKRDHFRRSLLSSNHQISGDMGVSKNNGTPKSSILRGFSILNHPFWGTPIFENTHMLLLRGFLSAFPGPRVCGAVFAQFTLMPCI